MNRPDEDSSAREAGQDTGPTPADDDEDPGGHLGNPANLESGAPVADDYDDDDDEPSSTS